MQNYDELVPKLREEKSELNLKIEHLQRFLDRECPEDGTSNTALLNSLTKEQLTTMKQYYSYLGFRISLLEMFWEDSQNEVKDDED
ncbi:crAss001_48 related protein [Limosilactobacillus caecicola]|uniref:crAss001_48 related protein n=1 Tax=Limosilactobacillus caecicola TaxID=2941332 RepID=UPI002041C3C4|nr:hypothetical protein [Limosilactobacillus caecicola]